MTDDLARRAPAEIREAVATLQHITYDIGYSERIIKPASAVAYRRRDEARDRLLALVQAQIEQARAELVEIERVIAEYVCPPSNLEGNEDLDAKYVCLNDDGEPIITADSLAEVVRQMSGCWQQESERASRAQQARAEGRREALEEAAQGLEFRASLTRNKRDEAMSETVYELRNLRLDENMRCVDLVRALAGESRQA